jgi:ubiquinone/menaquinone biosynthesis C-methylase UbiE
MFKNVLSTGALLIACTLHVQSSSEHSDRPDKTSVKALAEFLLNLPSGVTRSHRSSVRAQPHRHAPVIASETQTATATRIEPSQAQKLAGRGIKIDPALNELMASMKNAHKPGLAEKELFTNDPSCKFWYDFTPNGLPSARANLEAAAAIAAKYMPKPFDRLAGAMQAIDYWAKHAARTTFFVANAAAGVAAFQLSGKGSVTDTGTDIGGGDDVSGQLGLESGLQLVSSQMHESMLVFEQDWQRIVKNNYAMPWDLSAAHRQNSLPYALRQSARVVEETMGILERRTRAAPEDREIWVQSPDSIYPEYYKTNYHYQTDGWMSTKSANVYETSTETIFFGRQDAQQRTSLTPLQNLKGVNGRPLRILEVACGTGRFGTFVRDNHPTADITYVDLSPFYLEAARENDEYWREFRKGTNGGQPYAPAKFVQAAAEALPFDAESFDVVICMYLFHEMPEGPRAAAAAEMARVLAPGGTLTLTDSIQRGDRPALDDVLVGFENLNEPHYRNYIKTSLADLFVPHGLQCGHKYVACTSKTLSFKKPNGGAYAIR